MAPEILKPEWTLSGARVAWPDGERVAVTQSPWTATADGWTGVVSVPRGREGARSFHTAFITITKNGKSPDHLREEALERLQQRIRSSGPRVPVHLGEFQL